VGKQKRAGYIFKTFVGDHLPCHVHVFKDSRLIVKWDLENRRALEGTMNSKILQAIEELIKEGKL
jgi:hypothetical protein